jgi:hypothetical protein
VRAPWRRRAVFLDTQFYFLERDRTEDMKSTSVHFEILSIRGRIPVLKSKLHFLIEKSRSDLSRSRTEQNHLVCGVGFERHPNKGKKF